MAKIYQTHKDYERDQLDKQAMDLRLAASSEARTGSALFAGSLLLDLLNTAKGGMRHVLTIVSGALFIGSIVEAVKSWRTNSRAHDLELERQRLGPAQVVLPADMHAPGEMEPTAPTKASCCKSKRIQEALAGKTLLEHAEKPVDPGSKYVH